MEGSSKATQHDDIDDIDDIDEYKQLNEWMKLELVKPFPMSSSRCIFRVPHRLRCEREKAYTPQVICIGPLHHGKQAFNAMEEHKLRYLQFFMSRTTLSMMDYIEEIKKYEGKLRSCYSETIQLKSHEFVRIILLDAIFIIEFLFRFQYKQSEPDENDCIFGPPQMKDDVWRDLLMLENQLPFFILEKLLEIFIDSSNISQRGVNFSIQSLASYFLQNVGTTFRGMLNSDPPLEGVKHFVDLLRKLCIAPQLSQPSAEQPATAHSIEKLHLAGVKLRESSINNLFEIQFNNGILEIPKLKTDDSTELILRNLIAFEQCIVRTSANSFVTEYVSIMDMFVDTPKDVALLVKNKIVENILGGGDNDLSTMINSLSNGVTCGPRRFYYGKLCEDLHTFCSLKWNRDMTNLRHNYFNTPWATISVIAAVILLILTMVQTICSIISLVHER